MMPSSGSFNLITGHVNLNTLGLQRFWGFVLKPLDAGCWVWIGGRGTKGYGIFMVNGTSFRANRIAWIVNNGPIPYGLFVLHHCPGGGNPSCVNPNHLHLGDHEQNMKEMIEQGRAACGEKHGRATHPEQTARGIKHGNAKITDEIVLAIRLRQSRGESLKSIAAAFGITRRNVWYIAKRITWKHVT